MFKRIGALAMILAGSMAVFTPAVAQAGEYRHYERRVERRVERREWREHERWGSTEAIAPCITTIASAAGFAGSPSFAYLLGSGGPGDSGPPAFSSKWMLNVRTLRRKQFCTVWRNVHVVFQAHSKFAGNVNAGFIAESHPWCQRQRISAH